MVSIAGMLKCVLTGRGERSEQSRRIPLPYVPQTTIPPQIFGSLTGGAQCREGKPPPLRHTAHPLLESSILYRIMAQEPAIAKTPSGQPKGRWRWWYSAIADWMLRNPGGKLEDCARELQKHPGTISQIWRTDMFQEYLARRKEEFHQQHDFVIRSKMTAIAEASLDIMLDTMNKKKDQIPMQRLESIAHGTLDRLGYGPKSAPAVVIDASQNDNRQQVVQVSGLTPQQLEEAREALRLSERLKAGQSFQTSAQPLRAVTLDQGAGPSNAVSDVDALLVEGISDDAVSDKA